MMHLRKGEIEWRRDSLVLATAYITAIFACTALVLNAVHAVSRQHTVVITMLVKQLEEERFRNKMLVDKIDVFQQRVVNVEVQQRVLQDLTKENSQILADIHRRTKKEDPGKR